MRPANLVVVILVASVLALADSLRPSEAAAQFTVCNQSRQIVSVAIGYPSSGVWISKGWWNVEPGRCVTPIAEPLHSRYYYLRAEGDGGAVWEGGSQFCTDTSAFTIRRENCVTRGYTARGFLQIDTGNAAQWTQNLTLR